MLLILSLAAGTIAQPTDGRDAMRRSEQAPGVLTVHAMQLLCPSCWAYSTHEPRHLWADLFQALHITPASGIFIDGGTACDMVDGSWALSANFSVLGFETRPECLKAVREHYAAGLERAKAFGWPSNGALRLLHNALSNVSGATIDLFISGDSSSTQLSAVTRPNSLELKGFRGKDGKGNGRSLKTQTVTVDDAVGDRAVAALKLDLQGAELGALMGAHKLLSRPSESAPLVQFEYFAHLRPDLPGYEILHLLRGYGYMCVFLGFPQGNAEREHSKMYGPVWRQVGVTPKGQPMREVVRPPFDMPLPLGGAIANHIATDFVCVKRSSREYARLIEEQSKRARTLDASLDSLRALQSLVAGEPPPVKATGLWRSVRHSVKRFFG